MNLSSATLALATLALASTSVYLYTELDAEAALRQDLEARLRALEATRPGMEQQLQTPSNAYLAAESAASASVGGTGKVGHGTHGADATVATEDASGPNDYRNVLANPEERKNMLVQMKGMLRMDYRDLAGELHLSTEQADQLLGLLAEQRLEKEAAAEGPMTQVRRELEREHEVELQSLLTEQQLEKEAAAGVPIAHVRSELQREHEVELMTLLGGKYMQYEEYQNTLGERQKVEQFAVHFAAVNIPLSERQKRKLMTVMVEEHKAKPMPAESESLTYDENITRQREWQQDYDRRVLERISVTLTPHQLKQYEEMKGPS